MSDDRPEITFANVVGLIAFASEWFGPSAAAEYGYLPEIYKAWPFLLALLFGWGIYKGGLFGGVLVDILFLPVNVAMWPFQRAKDVEFFAFTTGNLQNSPLKTGGFLDNAWGRRFEGFLVGVASSVVATYLVDAIKVLKG